MLLQFSLIPCCLARVLCARHLTGLGLVVCSQGCQCFTLTSARVLALSTYRWASLPTHRHVRPTTQHSAVRALIPSLALLPPHVCHRQRDWAVSIGSHMQQDMDISKAPPRLGAPIPLFEYRSRLKTTIQKIGEISAETALSFVSVPTHVFRTAGHHMYRITHTCTSGATCAVTVERKIRKRAIRAVTVKKKIIWKTRKRRTHCLINVVHSIIAMSAP